MKQFLYILFFIVILVEHNIVHALENHPKIGADIPMLQTQEAKFASIIHDYKLEEKLRLEKEAQIAKIKTNITKYKNQVFNSNAPGRVTIGNPNGKIIIAEFTQHQCPHCQHAALSVHNLLKKYPEIQLIIIYWPFFGNDAVYTAKAVLAANKQNKAQELDKIFFGHQGFLTKNAAKTMLQTIPKIDSNKLFNDMNLKEFEQGLIANVQLAQKLQLIGTPVLIFTNKEMTKFGLLPGYTTNFEADLIKVLKEIT